jgi:hypothetical protein
LSAAGVAHRDEGAVGPERGRHHGHAGARGRVAQEVAAVGEGARPGAQKELHFTARGAARAGADDHVEPAVVVEVVDVERRPRGLVAHGVAGGAVERAGRFEALVGAPEHFEVRPRRERVEAPVAVEVDHEARAHAAPVGRGERRAAGERARRRVVAVRDGLARLHRRGAPL